MCKNLTYTLDINSIDIIQFVQSSLLVTFWIALECKAIQKENASPSPKKNQYTNANPMFN